MNRKLLLVVLSASLAIQTASLLLGSVAYGEPLAGRLQGVTLRADSRPLPQVVVIVHNVGENVDRDVVSNSDGSFTVGDLKPGHYQLTATKPGFEASQVTYVVVAAGDDLRFDLKLGEPAPTASTGAATTPTAPSASDPDAPSAIARELDEMKEGMDAMRARMEELEAKLKTAPAEPPVTPTVAPAIALATRPIQGQSPAESSGASPATPQSATAVTIDPFSDWDWTWLNGNSRQKDYPLDTKYFSPEFRADTFFGEDFNQPKDHTMGGSSEVFRSGEVQLEDLSLGGDFHDDNVRGRVLMLFGMFSATTVRNDASPAVGQWDVRAAYKYVSEAYGGYHFNVNHGLNIDAGIFVSYVGLFSYHNFDNWAYQPSYVSSNTPWFFNGVRIQWFPTTHLKIEPWIINGWQSYNKFNGHPGLGGQLKWSPKPWMMVIANQYGFGEDTLGIPNRSRYHTDDSLEIKYYDKPNNFLDRMAWTFTGDLGCETGGGVSCDGDHNGHPKQAFLGWMAYHRWWFDRDKYAFTFGGGAMNNPGRYLTLVLPVNGADAISGTPYFAEYPGAPLKAWDTTATFDWMPSQFFTWRTEFGYRYTSVPYWSGRGGVTPPGGNTGSPASYVCTNGSSSVADTVDTPSAAGYPVDRLQVMKTCSAIGAGWTAWAPDLRQGQALINMSLMVKF